MRQGKARRVERWGGDNVGAGRFLFVGPSVQPNTLSLRRMCRLRLRPRHKLTQVVWPELSTSCDMVLSVLVSKQEVGYVAGTCRQPWSWLTARLSPAGGAAVRSSCVRKSRGRYGKRGGQPGDMTVTAACKEVSNWAQQLGRSWANADHAASVEWLDTQPPILRNLVSAICCVV